MSSWSTAISSPSPTRPRPTIWPRHSPPAKSRPGSRGRSRSRSSPSRSFPVASWRRTTWSSSATSPSSIQPEVTALDDFLKQGGGVVVFGGDQVVAENYNRLLYDDGNGLLAGRDRPQRGRRRQEGGGLLLQSARLSPSARRRVSGRDRTRDVRADAGTLTGNITSS